MFTSPRPISSAPGYDPNPELTHAREMVERRGVGEIVNVADGMEGTPSSEAVIY